MTRTADGRCALRFEVGYDHSPEKVWRALTDPAHLRGWFAQYLDYDRSRLDFSAAGNELEFSAGAGDDQPPTETGRVLRSDPPSLLEYTWGDEVLRWELAPDDEDGCRLTFTNVFSDPAFAPYNALGWHTGLDRLEAVLSGDDPASIRLETDETAASELQRRYEEALS